MTTTIRTRPGTDLPALPSHSDHPVHLDPTDRALALLVDSDVTGELICDGSCAGIASCSLAPVDGLPTAA